MTKPKTLDQLQAEKEQAETQLAQEQHKLERLENRKKYLEKGERTKRTHRLCNLGGTIESLAPEVKDLTRTEMTELMERQISASEEDRFIYLYKVLSSYDYVDKMPDILVRNSTQDTLEDMLATLKELKQCLRKE